jgi:hypothetical protein
MSRDVFEDNSARDCPFRFGTCSTPLLPSQCQFSRNSFLRIGATLARVSKPPSIADSLPSTEEEQCPLFNQPFSRNMFQRISTTLILQHQRRNPGHFLEHRNPPPATDLSVSTPTLPSHRSTPPPPPPSFRQKVKDMVRPNIGSGEHMPFKFVVYAAAIACVSILVIYASRFAVDLMPTN